VRTLRLANDEKRARIVRRPVGPVERIKLDHVPSDWLIVSIGRGSDLTAKFERLRRAAIRYGYVVEEGVTVEDWNPKVRRMTRTGRLPPSNGQCVAEKNLYSGTQVKPILAPAHLPTSPRE
jgi:hypothetical protein